MAHELYSVVDRSRISQEEARGNAWRENMQPLQVEAVAFDGRQLAGSIFLRIPAGNNWLIAVHGAFCTRADVLGRGADFYGLGFNLLLVDSRGCGVSEGVQTFGYFERFDVAAWIQKIIAMDPTAQIVLYGISAGGAAVVMAAGDGLPPNVKCIVTDSMYSDIAAVGANIFEEASTPLLKFAACCRGLPKWRIFRKAAEDSRKHTDKSATCSRLEASLFAVGRWLAAAESNPSFSPVTQLVKSETPILIIQGEQDAVTSVQSARAIYTAAAGPKELWVVPLAGHNEAYETNREEYVRRFAEFTSRYVG
ncbi:MAG: alpha/beta hydrolase [Oscillospiraceae bacterium]|nr:alpha/beta hydrolase [Oscillospiraceae bacterium]